MCNIESVRCPRSSSLAVMTVTTITNAGFTGTGEMSSQELVRFHTFYRVKASGPWNCGNLPGFSVAIDVILSNPEECAKAMRATVVRWLFGEFGSNKQLNQLWALVMMALPAAMAVEAKFLTTALSPSDGPLPCLEPKKFLSRLALRSSGARTMSKNGPLLLSCAAQPSVHWTTLEALMPLVPRRC